MTWKSAIERRLDGARLHPARAAETGSASTQVLASAQSLSGESNHLKVEVDRFLSSVRAA